MSRLLALFKMQFNVNFGLSALRYKFTKEKKRRWQPIVIGLSLLFGLGPLLALYTLLVTGLMFAGTSLGHPEMVLTLTFMLSQVVILFFGFFYIMGNFYFSQDLETLVPLPLKPYEVLGSKFLIVLIDEYLTAFPILLPPIIIYGITTGQGILYVLKSIFLILSAPVIPLAIGAVLIMIIMRIVNLRKNKDLLAIVGGFGAIVLGVVFNVFIQRMAKQGTSDSLKNFLSNQTDLIAEIGRKFPPSIWATYGLSDPGIVGLGYFLLFLGVSAAMFLFLLWLSNIVFYKSLIAGQEVSRRRKVLTVAKMESQYKTVSNPVLAIFKREWKMLLRTPIYVINGLTGVIMGPIMVVIMLFAQGSNSDSKMLLKYITNPEYSVYILLGGLGLMLFTAGINLVASTSISREGRYFWIAKMIPVSARQQVLAKLLQGYMVSTIGIFSTAIVLGIFLKISIVYIFTLILVGLLGSVSTTALNLLVDVLHPKLVWNSEQEAMKQNLNGMLGMLVSIVIIGILAGCAVALLLLNLPVWAVFVGLGTVSTILGIPSVLILLSISNKIYLGLDA